MRVLVIDEGWVSGAELAEALADLPDVVASERAGLASALAAAAHHDIVLLNATAAATGRLLELIRLLVTSYPALKVLVVGVQEEGSQILPYIEAGADGYVSSQDSAHQLAAKIRAAYRNEALISPEVAALVMRRIAHLSDKGGLQRWLADREDIGRELTPDEQQLLALLSQQLTVGQIGQRLGLRERIVQQRVRAILYKLNVRSTLEAVAVYKLRLNNHSPLGASGD